MIRYVENAKKFGELDASERVELIIVAISIPLILAGLLVTVFTGQTIFGLAILVIGVFDFAVVSRVIPRYVQESEDGTR